MTRPKQQGLSRSELKTWRRFTKGTFALFAALDRQLRDEWGLSNDDFRVLAHLSTAAESSMRMSRLAEALSFSPSRLSHAVKRLEDKEWVARDSTIEDGRGRSARLTEEGRRILKEAWPKYAQLIKKLFLDQVDDDQRHLFDGTYAKIAKASAQHTRRQNS